MGCQSDKSIDVSVMSVINLNKSNNKSYNTINHNIKNDENNNNNNFYNNNNNNKSSYNENNIEKNKNIKSVKNSE